MTITRKKKDSNSYLESYVWLLYPNHRIKSSHKFNTRIFGYWPQGCSVQGATYFWDCENGEIWSENTVASYILTGGASASHIYFWELNSPNDQTDLDYPLRRHFSLPDTFDWHPSTGIEALAGFCRLFQAQRVSFSGLSREHVFSEKVWPKPRFQSCTTIKCRATPRPEGGSSENISFWAVVIYRKAAPRTPRVDFSAWAFLIVAWQLFFLPEFFMQNPQCS